MSVGDYNYLSMYLVAWYVYAMYSSQVRSKRSIKDKQFTYLITFPQNSIQRGERIICVCARASVCKMTTCLNVHFMIVPSYFVFISEMRYWSNVYQKCFCCLSECETPRDEYTRNPYLTHVSCISMYYVFATFVQITKAMIGYQRPCWVQLFSRLLTTRKRQTSNNVVWLRISLR